MREDEIRKLIRQAVREELAPILMGKVVSNQSAQRLSAQRFQTDNQVGRLRNVQPFGVSSRAPAGTDCLIVPIDANPTHLVAVGHFDQAKPELQDGEAALYDANGQLVYLSKTKIQIGSKDSDENLVLGKVFKQMMSQLLQILATHTHVGNLGYETAPPTQAADFTAIKSSPVDDEAVLSQKSFTE